MRGSSCADVKSHICGMDCAGRIREHGYRESTGCPSRRPAYIGTAGVGRIARPNDLVNVQLGATRRCVRLLGAAPSIGGIGAPPPVLFPIPVTSATHSCRAHCAGRVCDRRSRRGNSRQSPKIGVVMKGLVKYCQGGRMLRTLHHRWPYRRFHCRHDLHRLVRVRPSRRRCGQGRSYSRSNLNDARHNRPHTGRASDTGGGL